MFFICAAAGGAFAQSEDINSLLAQAKTSKTLSQAQELITRARQTLESQTGISQLDRDFFRADINRTAGRIYVTAWQIEPENEQNKIKAEKNLLNAISFYEQLHETIEQQVSSYRAKYRRAALAENAKWRELVGQLSRTNYAIAWTSYSLALIQDNTSRKNHYLDRAIELFSNFTNSGYQANPILADCFLGHAFCLYEKEHYYDASRLLDEYAITPENTEWPIFKQITYLRIKIYKKLGSNIMIETVAGQYFDRLEKGSRYDFLELNMAIERVRALSWLAAAPQQVNPYRQSYHRRLEVFSSGLYPYGTSVTSRLAQAMEKAGLVTPLTALRAARQAVTDENFALAAEKATEGLAADGDFTTEQILSDLRYIRAVAYLRLANIEMTFQSAAEFITEHPGDKRAPNVAKVAMQSGIEAVKKNDYLVERFLQVLDTIENVYDQQEDIITDVRWYRAATFLHDHSYAQALAALQEVSPGSRFYLDALYGRALANYKLASLDDFTRPDTQQKLRAAAISVSEFATAVKKSFVESPKLCDRLAEVALASAKALVKLEPPDTESAIQIAETIERLSCRASYFDDNILALRLWVSAKVGDMEKLDQLLTALKTRAISSDTLIDSLYNSARILRDRLDEQDMQDQCGHIVQLYRMARDLTAQSDNAKLRAQTVKAEQLLADALLDCGRYEEAADRYKLVEASMGENTTADVIEGLAIAQQKMSDFAAAAQNWTRLARATKKLTPKWYEANYNEIFCVYRSGNKAQANNMLNMFRARYDFEAVPQWQDKFTELQAEILK